jgi:hypothetical protein
MKESYNPFKTTVESIMEMCEKYAIFNDERANDFLNNIRVKCKDAIEFDKNFPSQTIDAEILELEDDPHAICSSTHLEIYTYGDLKKMGFKDGDKVKLIALKQ